MPLKIRHLLVAGGLLLPAVALVWQQSAPPAAKPAVKTARRKTPAAAKPVPVPTPQPPPKPLANPPKIVRAVYFTGWSAGLKRRVEYLVDLHRTTAINAVVVDIKDYSGNVAYRMGAPQARQYGAVRLMIRDIDGLVNRLHEAGIYVIARITVFQDPVLAAARPDLAVHRVSELPKEPRAPLTKASLWLDRKGLAWIDPASRPAWEYILAIAKDALGHGVDEVNFDYIRFPSDGDLKDMYFPNWDGKTPKHEVIRHFFAYLRRELAGAEVSVDVFGLATVSEGDLGIGQVIEDAYASFDDVCPMVYPSHFARHFLDYPSPAAHPYEVVSYSMREARSRLEEFSRPKPQPAAGKGDGPPAAIKVARVRPWLQDFNLGAKYNAAMVRAEIKAVEDALGDTFAGYMVWAPSNVYTRQALKEEPKKAEAAKAQQPPPAQQ